MELWAFHGPFTGQSQSGFRLATYTLPQQLPAGYAYSNISSGAIPFAPPPDGLWYYALLITEYDGSTFVLRSFGNANSFVVCDETGICGNGNMTHHGGAVQHNQKVYTIFWNGAGNSFPSGYQATINQFVQDLNGSSYYAIANQYGDSAGNVSPFVTLGGTWLDNGNLLGAPTLTASAGSSRAFFLDDLTTIPANNWGVVDITAGSGTANVIGLRFTGDLFTTTPATKMQ